MRALALLVVLAGCSPRPTAVPAPGAFERPLSLPETISGPVVAVLAEVTGMQIGAMALPGLPPLIFDSTADVCTIAHEARHKSQQSRDGDLRWTARYASDFAVCWLPGRRREDFARCYHGVAYEIDAMEAQTACMLARKSGEKGPT